MEFRILGDLEIIGPGGPLELRGAKRRGLTALMLVHAGQWLSTDRIVEDLWGDSTATGAARTVQTYVGQLRRSLDATSARITSRDGGYAFDLGPDALDASRFEQLLRRAASIADPDERLRSLDRALALWRGAPLQEFDAPWATREQTRLQLLHLQARDLHLDTRLALGCDGELVAELEILVDDNPLDERFWMKLLLAYYRSGRQADALRAFQRVKSTLAEQLGVDPGPELVQLEQRVLDHDESLLAPPHDGSTARRVLPTGTVTFLFTDIADSTRHWEEHPDEMRQAVADHHALLRDAINQHDGHVVKTIGDGLMAAFTEAPHAIAAATHAQLDLTTRTWPVPIAVRMGVHTGTAHLERDDYYAPTVNRASRVADTAHPEQILVSETTAALIDHASLRDLGEHRLRGLAPMTLHQVLAPGLRIEFPPTRASIAVNLPTPATSFVGRSAELHAVGELVREHRLVTLTGVGGCGKTRLAIEVAGDGMAAFADGVRFVDLAAVADDDGIDDAVIDALGLPAGLGDNRSRTRLASYLADRGVLVVLDNCEHLLDGCAELAETVLARPGPSHLLATSREPLGLLREHLFAVRSLEVETDAVSLFLDRARSARAEVVVDPAAQPIVAQICQRLDGIPLAIELAAARTAHLSAAQILDRLDDRFRLLTGGQRRIQRQQTLTATLDWSHDLLHLDEQEVLRRLAVFPAGFTLEAAESVVDRPDVLENLGSLVAKSLVQVVDDGDQVRYRLLETIRLYAETKLVDAGEAADVRTRHCHWVYEWLESLPFEERLLGDHDVLATGLPSVRAAVEWALAHEDFDVAAAIASGVDWSRTETWPDAFGWCERLLAEPDVARQHRVRLALMMWWLAPMQGWAYGRASAQPVLEKACPDDGPLYAVALSAAARDLIIPSVIEQDGAAQLRAINLAEKAVAASVDAPQPYGMYCRMWAGMTYASFRRPAEAAEHFAVDEEPEGPYRVLKASLDGYRAIMYFVMGDNARALALAQSAFSPDLWPYWSHARAVALVALAAEGDLDGARQALRDYYEVARDLYWVFGKESVVLLGGVLAGVADDWTTASLLLGAGHLGVRRTPADSILYHTFRDRARKHLGADRARACRDRGRAMPIEQALDLALR